MKKLRIYVDTSVIGGCFDEEFAEESRALIEMAQKEEVSIIISSLLIDELKFAPENVQEILKNLHGRASEQITVSEETIRLRDAYIKFDVITKLHRNDAMHVALATISRVSPPF